MSSEHFEERGGEEEEVELLRREGVGEESLVEAPEEGAVEEEPRILYDVTKPELLETMIIASDILTRASLGQISLGEARRLYEREVVARIKKLVAGGVVVKKKAKARRAERKTEKKKAKAEVEKEKKAKKEAKEGKKARGKRKEGGGVEGEG